MAVAVNAKDCIAILTGNESEDLADLNRCLALVAANVLPSCADRVDVLVFHESSFNPLVPHVVARFDLRFVEIAFEVPAYPADVMALIPEYFQHPTQSARGRPGFSMGYRHMCRFFAGAMYQHPAIQEYRRCLRLDTDSAVLTPMAHDVFAWAERENVQYGYIAPGMQVDCPLVGHGFHEFLSAYRPGEALPARDTVFYTNIEMSDVRWFRSGAYDDYWRAVDRSAGIYLHRWGDHLIKYAGVQMLMDPRRLRPMTGFTY